MLEVRVWAHETEGALGTAGDSCEAWGAREPHPGPENPQKKPAPLDGTWGLRRVQVVLLFPSALKVELYH